MLPLIVLSDLHLSGEASSAIVSDLARLLQQNQGHEFVLAGDVFNLSWEAPGHSAIDSVLAFFRSFPELTRAVREHVARGTPLTILAGNHDTGLMDPALRDALLRTLELSDAAPLSIEPWFVRRAGVHIEHGHFYDPDNAPAHPLAVWSPETEPLGIALTRRFLRPSEVHHFAHAHETTPLAGIVKAFRIYGARTPAIICDWFRVAGKLCLESRQRNRFQLEELAGETRLLEFAEAVAIEPDVLRILLRAGAEPTHRDFRNTFMRLYFDRVFASMGLVLSGTLGLAWKSRSAGVAALCAGLYLIQSVQRSGNRYQDLPEERLRRAAQRVRELTSAESVIFGHTHHVDQAPGYANCGSFGYGRQGRPYVRVSDSGALSLARIS